jgi:hypothetical protein
MNNDDFESLLKSIGLRLKNQFAELNGKQQSFIQDTAEKGNLLFIENQRFTLEERTYSDTYKITKALGKVLALEYEENVSL